MIKITSDYIYEFKMVERSRKKKQDLFALCPQWGGCIEIVSINCRIFRHGAGLNPHATDSEVLHWKTKTRAGRIGLGWGAKIQWKDNKFILYQGFDLR